MGIGFAADAARLAASASTHPQQPSPPRESGDTHSPASSPYSSSPLCPRLTSAIVATQVMLGFARSTASTFIPGVITGLNLLSPPAPPPVVGADARRSNPTAAASPALRSAARWIEVSMSCQFLNRGESIFLRACVSRGTHSLWLPCTMRGAGNREKGGGSPILPRRAHELNPTPEMGVSGVVSRRIWARIQL